MHHLVESIANRLIEKAESFAAKRKRTESSEKPKNISIPTKEEFIADGYIEELLWQGRLIVFNGYIPPMGTYLIEISPPGFTNETVKDIVRGHAVIFINKGGETDQGISFALTQLEMENVSHRVVAERARIEAYKKEKNHG